MSDLHDISHYAELDARMLKAARGLRILSLMSWPASLQQPFLDGWNAGKPELPQVEYPKLDFSEARRELDAVAEEADPTHPLGATACGEGGACASMAAFANAIYNAIGVRVKHSPFTPDVILGALGKIKRKK